MDEKPPCDECSSYDFSCTGACEKPIMADSIVYNTIPFTATITNITNAVTTNTIAFELNDSDEWNWPAAGVHCAHPVFGFVTRWPGALTYRVREEAPRSRTVMFRGRPLRLYWPRLAFFVQESGRADCTAPLFVFRVDGDAPLAADTPLRHFPFTLWSDPSYGRVASYSHVSQIGAVCFDGDAQSLMRTGTRDPVDVFWSSGFSKIDDAVLAKWAGATPAQVLSPGFFIDADWRWNRYAPGGLTVEALLAGTKMPVMPAITVDSKVWTG